MWVKLAVWVKQSNIIDTFADASLQDFWTVPANPRPLYFESSLLEEQLMPTPSLVFLAVEYPPPCRRHVWRVWSSICCASVHMSKALEIGVAVNLPHLSNSANLATAREPIREFKSPEGPLP